MINEPIVGVRLWLPIYSHGLLEAGLPLPGLRSTAAHYPWVPGKNVAKCPARNSSIRFPTHVHPDGAAIPAQKCICGLHAFYSPDHLQGFFTGSFLVRGVMGVVRGWGNVRLHPDGWRSEYAEIMALLSHPNNEHNSALAYLLPQIAENYGVPIVNYSLAILEEFGTIVPRDLRPHA